MYNYEGDHQTVFQLRQLQLQNVWHVGNHVFVSKHKEF